jgi:PAS domain S-box-containing protein
LVANGHTDGSLFSPTGTDNIPRVVSYRRISRYPLYVFVGISKEEYLASFWRDFIKVLVLLLVSFLASAVSGVVIYRTRLRDQDVAMQLARQKEKYRIVADNTFEWEFWLAPDGTVVYCSPSCSTKTGRSAAEFYADPELFLSIVHPEDKADYERHRRSAHRGNQAASFRAFRILHTDGTTRWIEHVCQSVGDDAGHFLGVRGSNRDITERRQAEMAREEALLRVRTLEGIIPICMYCKKIRDNQNSWSELDRYISEHSEAKFSHGICPNCIAEHRVDFE